MSGLAIVTLAATSLVATASPASAASPFLQVSPTSGVTTVVGSATFTGGPILFDNTAVLPVTFTPTSSTPAGVNVDANGAITTTGPLAAGSYTASGTATDVGLNTGTWTYTLTVGTISQTSAISASTTPALSASAVLGSIAVTNVVGSATFSPASSTPVGVGVDANGAITASRPLAVGNYPVSGTDSDTSGDTGTWSFTLHVNAVTLNQTSPTSGSTTSASSATFAIAPLSVSGGTGAITFVTTSSGSRLHVTSGGVITTAGSLGVGSYVVSGTDSDSYGDTGAWTFTLSVVSVALVQTSALTATTTSAASATLVIAPITVANAIGTVNFVTTSTSIGLKVSAQGQITTTGPLAAGVYVVFGSVSDGFGEIGNWTFTLTVSGAVVAVTFGANGGTGTMAAQSAIVATPLTTNTFTRVGYSFAGWNTTADGSGTAYANGATYPFSAAVTLFAQWAAAPIHTVTFRANGGKGLMGAQHSSTPGRLTRDRFTRAGYSFAGWNTAANGSGIAYANRATYSFSTSTPLYAQWSGAASHLVTFNANGGIGSMGRQHHQGPTNLARNQFTRSGYVFTNWNTLANGSGIAYANGATYSFKRSSTLYAQWRVKAANIVTFNANGGKGVVGPQGSPGPAALTSNGFTRTGFVFKGWNTTANGSGTGYANGATYSFSTSIPLYAQWRAVKKPVTPAIHAVVTLSSFGVNSYELSTSLQSQVASLAKLIKANRDTQVVLLGYGDTLSKTDQLNELKWAAELKLSKQRAIAVEAYLTLQLHSLGVNGFSISVTGQGATNPGPAGTSDAQNRRVVATIT